MRRRAARLTQYVCPSHLQGVAQGSSCNPERISESSHTAHRLCRPVVQARPQTMGLGEFRHSARPLYLDRSRWVQRQAQRGRRREQQDGHSHNLSVANIAMADVLRLVDRFDGLARHPACRAYVARATVWPAFAKSHADQMAHFAKANRKRMSGRLVRREAKASDWGSGQRPGLPGLAIQPLLSASCGCSGNRRDTCHGRREQY